jgi:hypothetical protein
MAELAAKNLKDAKAENKQETGVASPCNAGDREKKSATDGLMRWALPQAGLWPKPF